MKIFKILGALLLTVILLLSIGIYRRVQDRHPDYDLKLTIKGSPESDLKIGFAKVSINPELPDKWIDVDGDGHFYEENGDYYEDLNGNNKFDASWIAGFSSNRPANGIHDTLWARTFIVDDGTSKVAMVAIDAIGLGSDDVITARKRIAEQINIDYVSVSTSHTHEAPDLIGIWGPTELESGVDPEYKEIVIQGIVNSVISAFNNLEKGFWIIGYDPNTAERLVEDTRPPYVLDAGVTVMRAISKRDSTTLGSVVAWANHPEVVWDANTLISSDFPHYVRFFMEQGVNDTIPGVGGTCVYLNGTIGGLMTTTPSMIIKDPLIDTSYTGVTFEKAEALGKDLAMIALRALDNNDTIEQSSIDLIAESVYLKLDNPLFRIAAIIGKIDRGMTGWFEMRSEVSYWTMGPVSFLNLPGEIYPEIMNGGVEAPQGQDFDLAPLETPHLRSFIEHKYQITVGLSNDMIGYVVPKSQWDAELPYTYEQSDAPYGEINSVGPETSPVLYKIAKNQIQSLNP